MHGSRPLRLLFLCHGGGAPLSDSGLSMIPMILSVYDFGLEERLEVRVLQQARETLFL